MYKPGTRFKSAVCSTEVVIVKAPTGGELRCGGAPMSADAPAAAAGAPAAGWDGGSQLGKRYEDTETGLQVLVVKAGDGALGVDDRALTIVSAKALPASD